MSIPSSPEVERAAEAMREKGAWCGACAFGERYLDDEGNDQPCAECVSITEGYARAAAPHFTQPLLAEIERLKKEREDGDWVGEVLSMVDTALKAHGRHVAPMFFDDEIHRAFAQRQAAEAEAQKLREALKELRGFFGVKAECRVPEQVARDIIDKALGGSK